ncbi:MAG: nitroreductase family protein [Nocardioides sp.]
MTGPIEPRADDQADGPTAPYPTEPAPTSDIRGESLARVTAFADALVRRRTVRDFSSQQIPDGVLEQAIRAAASAPSGANLQPWRFVIVTDPDVRARLRQAAEAEEREFYGRRAPEEWLAALGPLGTDAEKPFLQEAAVVIAVFEVHKGPNSPRPYYPKESVGIAVGFLLAALHTAGLATLTHTPSPMKFLNEILGRPPEERGFLLVPVGYPAPGARVPAIARKPLDEVIVRR